MKPVLKCCIERQATTGFCKVCQENFAFRQGPYYPGFRYRDDDELLERMVTGEKPFASIPRKEEEPELEIKIADLGLHLIRKFRNHWGVLEYHVMKDLELRLSDVCDLDVISDLLGVDIHDRKIRDIHPNPMKVYQGLMFGYPFYTLTDDEYLI